jgi:hypothetical protein
MADPEEHGKDEAAIAVAQINAKQIIIVTVITAISGTFGAAIQGYFSSRQVNALKTNLARTTGTIEGLQKELEGPAVSVVERKALYQLTADVIESDVKLTSNKRDAVSSDELSDQDLQYKRIRRSVFVHMGELRANTAILQNTLDEVSKRGYDWIAQQKPKIVADFPTIKAAKLRWIEDHAIPALQDAIDEIQRHPFIQNIPRADVQLPREMWILQHKLGEEPTITVTDMTALKSEAALIKQSL